MLITVVLNVIFPCMSINERIKSLVPVWGEKIGRTRARKRLSDKGIGLSTADQMLGGRYGAVPGDRTADILRKEMAKDGVSLTDEVAS